MNLRVFLFIQDGGFRMVTLLFIVPKNADSFYTFLMNKPS